MNAYKNHNLYDLVKSDLVYIFYYLICFNFFFKIFDNLMLKTLWTLQHFKIYETNIGNERIMLIFLKYDEWVNATDNFLSSYSFLLHFLLFSFKFLKLWNCSETNTFCKS